MANSGWRGRNVDYAWLFHRNTSVLRGVEKQCVVLHNREEMMPF
ncbi:hypothetical protein ABIE12_000055 [Serratia sp. 509]